MEFYGETVEEVIAKALGREFKGKKPGKVNGKPNPFGKPGSNFGKTGTRTKPGKFGKRGADENPHATPQAIARARRVAISTARAWIRRASVRQRLEQGLLVVYDLRSGLIDPREAVRAGVASSHDFRFRMPCANHYALLATAHTHNRSRSRDLRLRDDEDDLNEDWSAIDGRELLPFAPAFLKTPSGDVLEHLNGPFRVLTEHPKFWTCSS